MKTYIEVVNNLITQVVETDYPMPANYIEIATTLSHQEIINSYYKDNILKQFPPKPSAFHTFDTVTETYVLDLAEYRNSKANEINIACSNYIIAGFNSSALGVTYSYPSGQIDQINLMASVTDSYNPTNPVGWTTSFWCADSLGNWAFTPHTADQIRQVGSDGKEYISQAILKNASLQAQVLSAATQSELDLIQW
jgi:hypothetical protein